MDAGDVLDMPGLAQAPTQSPATTTTRSNLPECFDARDEDRLRDGYDLVAPLRAQTAGGNDSPVTRTDCDASRMATESFSFSIFSWRKFHFPARLSAKGAGLRRKAFDFVR
ncbi:hypothetical protein QAD02_001625 [Eretmocerus hayati]|uniref:Uncharacterized protein n=1 Tax=Eretmocerus hayati TaxID=131215 RepID=A0ACC2NHG5_9HYME|nr:hypothetical protein QAD02_001625 [Eretmocerus hayati]